jgi:uncharacterized damage-inducible protein DinB
VIDVRRLLAYDQWANGEALASLERAGSVPPKCSALLNHVLATELGWLDRMGAATPFTSFWPGDDLPSMRRAWEALPARWAAFLADARLSAPARTFEYVNSKGERWTNTVGDVVHHVLMHSAYHRGQIASHLRAGGGEPSTTDFVHAARQGLIDAPA